MSEIKWIKITTDMFDDEKIKLIDGMPERDTILVIWLKILTLAGKCNKNGRLVFSDNIGYDEEMLSTLFNRPINSIRLAMSTFKKFNMISYLKNKPDNNENTIYLITNWSKHQSVIESKEYWRIKQAEYRGKQKQKQLENNECQRHVNDMYEDCQTQEERIKEVKNKRSKEVFNNKSINNKKDIGINRHIVEHSLDAVSSNPNSNDKNNTVKNTIYDEIINYLNLKCSSRYKSTTPATKTIITARLREGFKLDEFKTVIDIKTDEWLNDPKMSIYLRPSTLFGTKFESYLNQKPSNRNISQRTLKNFIVNQEVKKIIEEEA
jgi:predicted phage replisome organizer/uncharacterized phage protein (TIGR02220 family)